MTVSSEPLSVSGAPPSRDGDGPDHSMADFFWCLMVAQRGWSIEETASKLLEVSGKAQERAREQSQYHSGKLVLTSEIPAEAPPGVSRMSVYDFRDRPACGTSRPNPHFCEKPHILKWWSAHMMPSCPRQSLRSSGFGHSILQPRFPFSSFRSSSRFSEHAPN